MPASNTAHTIVAAIVIGLACLVCLPVLSLCTYYFYQDWNQPYLVKKYRGILLSFMILIAVQTLIEFPVDVLRYISPSLDVGFTLHTINAALGWQCRLLFYTLVALRAYMLH